jgi:hypothetical protein
VYYENNQETAQDLTVNFCPYPTATAYLTVTVSCPKNSSGTVTVDVQRYYVYDSLFIEMYSVANVVEVAYDTGEPYDGFSSNDAGVTYARADKRYFVAFTLSQSVGDLPVAGFVNIKAIDDTVAVTLEDSGGDTVTIEQLTTTGAFYGLDIIPWGWDPSGEIGLDTQYQRLTVKKTIDDTTPAMENNYLLLVSALLQARKDASTTLPLTMTDGTYNPLHVRLTNAETFQDAIATESTLADIKTAVQVLDNIVSGNEAQIDLVNAEVITGVSPNNKTLKDLDDLLSTMDGRLTTINTSLNQIEAAVEIMDDWDDSDSAKVTQENRSTHWQTFLTGNGTIKAEESGKVVVLTDLVMGAGANHQGWVRKGGAAGSIIVSARGLANEQNFITWREGIEGDAYDGSNAGDLYLGNVVGANFSATFTGYMRDA